MCVWGGGGPGGGGYPLCCFRNLKKYLFAIAGNVESFADELGGERGVAVLPLHVELDAGHGQVVLPVLDDRKHGCVRHLR